MVNRAHIPTFGPRVSVLFANLDTVREVNEILEADLDTDMEHFRRDVTQHVQSQVAALHEWSKPEFIGERIVHFTPGRSWELSRNERLAVHIDLGWPIETNPILNTACVGLFVPTNSKRSAGFRERFRRIKPGPWVSLDALDALSQEECDPSYPFWVPVSYDGRCRNGSFSVDSFVHSIVKRVSEAVALRPRIDRILKSLE